MWCHFCDKNNHNMADCKEIAKIKQQKKSCFEDKSRSGKKSLAFLFEKLKTQKASAIEALKDCKQ
jgi:tellurite resistance protein